MTKIEYRCRFESEDMVQVEASLQLEMFNPLTQEQTQIIINNAVQRLAAAANVQIVPQAKELP